MFASTAWRRKNRLYITIYKPGYQPSKQWKDFDSIEEAETVRQKINNCDDPKKRYEIFEYSQYVVIV